MDNIIELNMEQMEQITGGTDRERIREAWRLIGENLPKLGHWVRTDPMSLHLYEVLQGLCTNESSGVGTAAMSLKMVIMESALNDEFKNNACQLCDIIIQEAQYTV